MNDIKKIKRVGIIVISLIMAILLVFITVFVMFKKFKDEPLKIVVIGKAELKDIDFWVFLKSGMEMACKELNVEFNYVSPIKENDVERQKVLIEETIKTRPDAICLIASSYEEIAPYAKKISDNRIPFIVLDSDVNFDSDMKKSFIATNNYLGGEKVANYFLEKNSQSEENHAIILGHTLSSKTQIDRTEGFINSFTKNPKNGYDIFYCEADELEAYEKAKEKLEREIVVYGKIKTDIIFATNEVTAVGVAKYIEEKNLQNKIFLGSFDASKRQVGYLESGVIDCSLVQYAFKMGYLAIQEAQMVARGKSVPKNVDTGLALINSENMYDREMQEIIFPF